MTNIEIKQQLEGKLIVSCQALEEEPLFSSFIMERMAYAAMLGGASGIRANTVVDICEIKKTISLPIIGIIKKVYEESNVYITPTIKEVDDLVQCGCEIIAIDATKRMRPNNMTLEEFFSVVRKKYPTQLFMADCSTIEEGEFAAQLGFDFIGTTMSGYTTYTKNIELPNYHMMEELVKRCDKPVIAEGGIWEPKELERVMETGVFAAVIGTAITRPRDITKRFVRVIQKMEK
ncbi:MAG: N-acetylmannosamine-6-phosphate 2-epimerase [Lachnospiraceae bacterium]